MPKTSESVFLFLLVLADRQTRVADHGVLLFSVIIEQAATPGCTNQACGFRDYYEEISKLGYDVWGLSTDKPNAQKNVSPGCIFCSTPPDVDDQQGIADVSSSSGR